MDHSLTTTGNNKLLCQYCHQPCVKLFRERKRRWWHECDKCSVTYLASLQGRLEIISFKTKGVEKFYAIEVNLKKKTSHINQWENVSPPKMKPRYGVQSIKDFDKVLDNLTPENFQDRLKTYLIFL